MNSCPKHYETLDLVANEHRLAIVRTLWNTEEDVLGFTDLRHQTGMDRSAHFNYHLQQLVGPCLRTTAEGYALTTEGRRFLEVLHVLPPTAEGKSDAT